MEHLPDDHTDFSNSRRIVIRKLLRKGSFIENWASNMIKISNGGKAGVKKILGSEEIKLSKREGTASVTIRHPS